MSCLNYGIETWGSSVQLSYAAVRRCELGLVTRCQICKSVLESESIEVKHLNTITNLAHHFPMTHASSSTKPRVIPHYSI